MWPGTRRLLQNSTRSKTHTLTRGCGVEQLCTGICRLVLFCIIFIALVQCNDVGVPSTVRLGLSSMLADSLDIAEFKEINTLNGFQDFLMDSSERCKALDHQPPPPLFGVGSCQEPSAAATQNPNSYVAKNESLTWE